LEEKPVMQQSTRRLAILVGGTLVASVGLFLAACSTDNGTTTPLPGQGGDSGRRDSSGGTSGTSGTSGEDPDADVDDDGGSSSGADCGNAPRLRNNGQGFFCAFLPRDAGSASDAGGTSNCAHDETCCNPARVGTEFPKSYCANTPTKTGTGETACAAQAAAKNSTWTANMGSTWQCGDKNNCGASQVCCLFSQAGLPAGEKVNIGKNLDTQIPPACNAQQAFKYGGTKCAAACGAEEIQLCGTQDQNCTGGKTCSPFEVDPGGRNLAYCK